MKLHKRPEAWLPLGKGARHLPSWEATQPSLSLRVSLAVNGDLSGSIFRHIPPMDGKILHHLIHLEMMIPRMVGMVP